MKAVRVFLGLLLVVGATYGQNVGIGTSAPVGKLHVVGSAGVGRSVIIDNREIKFRGDGVAHISIFGPTTGRDRLSISRSSSSAIPGTEDAELVSITAAGNVGIGQPTPAGHLTIRNGWQNWIQLEDAINGHQYYFHNPGGGDRLEVGVYDAGAGTTRWGVWVVTPAGNIGIGTTAPTQRLDVNGNVQFSGALMPGGIPGTAGQVLVSQGATTPPIWRYEVPPGGIIMYSGPWNFDATGLGTGPLTGWALCNGNNGTPDLSDRFVLATNTAAQVGTTGGAHTYTLTIAQLPPHTHTISADGTHTHDIYGVFHGQDNEGDDNCPAAGAAGRVFSGDDNIWPSCTNPALYTFQTGSAGSHNHGGATGATGSGAPIDNRPAFIRLAFIMKL